MSVTLETPLAACWGRRRRRAWPSSSTCPPSGTCCGTTRAATPSGARWPGLDDLQVGDRVTILAQVTSVSSRRMRQRHGTITEVTVGDGAGS